MHFDSAARLLFAASASAAIAGCGARMDDGGATAQSAAPSKSLRITGVEGFRDTLAQLRGKVVLVDFWATWCAPCLEQFPHTVALHRKYQNRGLAVIGVSLNMPGDEPAVRDFLGRSDARFDNLLSKYESAVEAIGAFGLPGPVPCYRVYDRAGELRHEFVVNPRAERQFTPDDIEAAVTEFL